MAAPVRIDLEPMYRLAFEAAADGMVIHEDGRMVAANPAARRLMGEANLEGRRVVEFIPPSMHAAAQAAMVQGGQCEVRLVPSQGPSLPVVLHALPTSGRRALLMLHDVAAAQQEGHEHRRRHERDAEVARLEQLNHFKTQLLNTAAHELNTPLTPLRLQVHLLRSESLGHLSERQLGAVDVLERSTERLSMLVSDILDVARLESGHLRMDVEDVPINDLIEESAQAYEETARGVGVALEVEMEPDLTVRVDPRRILQVLYNLVSNAIKFTPEGGRVLIRSGTLGGLAHVEVEDSGLGLNEQQIEGLFQPFSRVHDTESTAIPGTGLGLYISRGIVRQHSGVLWVTSPGPGRGACFRFTLPLSAEPLRPPRPKVRPSSLVTGPLAQRLRELI